MKKTMRFGWPEAMGVLSVAICALVLLAPREVRATAATAEVDTPARDGVFIVVTQGSNTIYAGTLVVLDSNGKAEHATDATSKHVIGRAEVTQDNTGSSYLSTRTIKIRRGTFRWTNGDSFTDANIGDFAYVEDNQTVQKSTSATYDIIAGIIVDVDDDGVWCDCLAIGGQGAVSLATLEVAGASTLTGAAALGSTLAVDGAANYASTVNVGGTFTASNTASLGTASVTGKLSVANTAGFSGAVNVAGALTASNKVVFTPETLTMTKGAFTLTPTQSLYYVAGQYGVVTMNIANATSPGMFLTIVNLVGTNVVIEDSTTSMVTFPSGFTSWTNGQYDIMQFVSESTNWHCVGTQDN